MHPERRIFMGEQWNSVSESFSKLFSELENRSEDAQKQKDIEMNGLVEEMKEDEFDSIFSTIFFNEMVKMVEEKKLSLDNAILLLKQTGYCKSLKRFSLFSFDNSLLRERIEEIDVEEYEKKEEKNETLLTDLSDCYLLLNDECTMDDLLSIFVPCLLKVVLKKEENEETQKEVETAFLALSNTMTLEKIEKGLYANEIKEIIKCHQEHRNLTQLAYQSA